MGRELTKVEAEKDGLIITISARSNKGKTTVARLIEEMLRKEGFIDVSVFDDPHDSVPDKESIEKRVEAAKQRVVYIETIQLAATKPLGDHADIE
jgi:uridine kinase